MHEIITGSAARDNFGVRQIDALTVYLSYACCTDKKRKEEEKGEIDPKKGLIKRH